MKKWPWAIPMAAAIAVSVWQARSRPPDILLVSIDTLRADHVGAYGYPIATTPFVDSIAASGAVFDNVIVPLPATDPSHAAMLTGLHPFRTGVTSNALPLAPGVETIALALRRAGYDTMGVTGVYHLSGLYGFDRGFAHFRGTSREQVARSADDVTADAIDLIHAHADGHVTNPFFLMVHFFDVHAPYDDHDNLAGDDEAEDVRAYDSEVRFVDDHLRQVWRALETAGMTKHLMVIITADHGEQLGEHGLMGGHADIYRETVRVPLIVAGPGVTAHHVPSTISSMDLAPTVLDLAGTRFDEATDGVSVESLAVGTERARDESVMVVGYPTYTRSVGLWSNGLYYVRNFDRLSRSVASEPIASSESHAAEALTPRVTGEVAVFRIPSIDFESYEIDVDVLPKHGCQLDVSITIPTSLDVVHQDIGEPRRFRYVVGRLDPGFVSATPAACVDRVTWSRRRVDGPVTGDAAAIHAANFFDRLLSMRRHRDVDEVYDVVHDPQMAVNLIDSLDTGRVSRLAALARATFEAEVAELRDGPEIASGELERLRSLGYVR